MAQASENLIERNPSYHSVLPGVLQALFLRDIALIRTLSILSNNFLLSP